VVWPRIQRLRQEHPEARTTSGFAGLLEQVGAGSLLGFRGAKPERDKALTRFFLGERVETEADLKAWLTREENLTRLRHLPGIGPKTVDYLQILAGLDTSEIDRHLALFLEQAGVEANTYEERKAIIDAPPGCWGWAGRCSTTASGSTWPTVRRGARPIGRAMRTRMTTIATGRTTCCPATGRQRWSNC